MNSIYDRDKVYEESLKLKELISKVGHNFADFMSYEDFRKDFPYMLKFLRGYFRAIDMPHDIDTVRQLWESHEVIDPSEWDVIIDYAEHIAAHKSVDWTRLFVIHMYND